MDWRNIIRGFAMGVTDLIPGVSGGTIAMVLGVYQRLVAGINGFYTRDWKKHFAFLIPLGVGIVIALLTVSGLIEWLLEAYPQPTFFFFEGLLLGIVPFLLKEVDFRRTFSVRHYIVFIIAAILIALMMFVREDGIGQVKEQLALGDYLFLFMAGWLGSSAMILPGISGSFVLLLLGAYPTVINALSERKLAVIAVVGAGVIVGLLLTSKLIHYLLNHYRAGTYAAMVGLVFGSLFVIFPGLPGQPLLLVVSVICFALGLALAVLLGRVEHQSK